MGNKRNIALGALLAGAAGYVAGVLTAPKSGRETRKDIKQKAAKAKTEAEHKLKEAHSELNNVLEQANKKITSGKEAASKELKQAVDKANVAKQKARDLLSAVHEGEAEDADLQKAIQEVKKAIAHTRKYLAKKPAQ